jgi:hypothetical protein
MAATTHQHYIPVVRRRGAEAGDRLTGALINLAAAGQRTHCSEAGSSAMWLSEDEAERAHAVLFGRGCPVLTECREVGEHQSFGVFGGKDRTRSSKPEPKPKAAA